MGKNQSLIQFDLYSLDKVYVVEGSIIALSMMPIWFDTFNNFLCHY